MEAVFDRKASARVSVSSLTCASCGAPVTPTRTSPRRNRCSSAGNCAMTRAVGTVGLMRWRPRPGRQRHGLGGGFGMLGAVAHRRHAQHLGPGLEQGNHEFPRAPACRRACCALMVYWIASVSRCSTCWATLMMRAVPGLGQVLRKNFELRQHQLEHALASLGVLLDHLHDAAVRPQRATVDGAGVKSQHAGAMRSMSWRAGWARVAEELPARPAPRAAPAPAGDTKPRAPRDAVFAEDAPGNIRPPPSMTAFSLAVLAFS